MRAANGERLAKVSYAIHKKVGTIKEIPYHAVGWMNRSEWVCRDTWPTPEQYFASLKKEDKDE